MMQNIDPLIQREFDRLGINILESDHLADLVIAKVRNRRTRKFTLIALYGALAIAIGFLLYLAGSALNGSSGDQIQLMQSSSLASPAGANGSLSLPQFAVIEVDTTKPEGRNLGFSFDLKAMNMFEIISEIPQTIRGLAGSLEVYQVNADKSKTFITKFDLGSGTHINDFSIPTDGKYQIIFRFSDPNFKGRMRVAFLEAH
jgi:hypothetical protein